jgi:uncharacterized Zn-binding protein involved in type VI secretion
MASALTANAMASGPIVPNPAVSGASPILPTIPLVLVGGQPAAVVGSPTPLNGPVVVPIAPTVLIANQPAAVQGTIAAVGASINSITPLVQYG